MVTRRPSPSKGADPRRIKLAMQTSRCSQPYSIGGRRKEGSHAPKPVTLPKLKCLQEPLPDEQ